MQQSALLQAKAYYLVKPTEFNPSLLILKREAVGPIERGVHGEPAAAPERSPLFLPRRDLPFFAVALAPGG